MWIKVCGIRSLETAQQLIDLKVDAIGLNFYQKSPRSIELEQAVKVSHALPAEMESVGLFVNHPVREIVSIAQKCRIDIVQLHGDEPPSYVAELHRKLPDMRIIRAWRMGKDQLDGLSVYLSECQHWGCKIAGCLVDSHVTGIYGGSGKTVPWARLSRAYNFETWPPLILAGGLHPGNIAEAITAVHPWGVDVASGVESSPGVKDLELMQQFVANARSAI